jgi:hypothetical protein
MSLLSGKYLQLSSEETSAKPAAHMLCIHLYIFVHIKHGLDHKDPSYIFLLYNTYLYPLVHPSSLYVIGYDTIQYYIMIHTWGPLRAKAFVGQFHVSSIECNKLITLSSKLSTHFNHFIGCKQKLGLDKNEMVLLPNF